MSSVDRTYERINDYTAVKLTLARPHDIRSWSKGEVKKPETINYRTYRPEKDGLFCERIFGPEKDWECTCGKYRGMKYKGMICDRCGVKISHSRVRRHRMGHIELAAPVVHIWFFKSTPSRLGNLLDIRLNQLEKVIYFQDYIVIDPGDEQITGLKKQQLLTESEYREKVAALGRDAFQAEMGAEAIRKLLEGLDLSELAKELRDKLANNPSKQDRKNLRARLKIVEAISNSENSPEWMVLDVIPVIPPDLRPLVMLESGNFATSDLNDLYRRIINRNNRLRKLQELNAPEVIVRNEKRMLQQSVDALFDNERCKRPVQGSSNRALKSLTDMIKGKQGRFRENLLGKRVDYSARSVIVVGPTLRLHQCGLPKKIALELFQPFIIRRLKELDHADTIKSAKKMLERKDEEVWDILEEVIRNHPVMLNRAPTLHRMGIQAFEPILVEGNAIKLHPLVCKGFNADFDGDQMAVHLPLSIEAQVEAHTLMMSTNNIFSPANGNPIMSPSQDVVMGCYYMTLELADRLGEGMVFSSFEEIYTAYDLGKVQLHTPIEVRLPKGYKVDGEPNFRDGGRLKTTVGRVFFNDNLPKGMPFYNLLMTSKMLQKVISDCYELLGTRETINLLDDMKQMGYRQSTKSGLSFATDDLITPAAKQSILDDAERMVLQIQKDYRRGLITERERYAKVLDLWTATNTTITTAMTEALDNDHRRPGYVNPIYLMSQSGARGGIEQIRQLSGMRGLMAKPNGTIIETPIKANFREGLSVLEYFSSTHGARKGLADTALKTADSGYMTRKLADVAQNVVVTMEDCGTHHGITKGIIYNGEKVEVNLVDSIKGRVSCVNIMNPYTDTLIVKANEMITPDAARAISELGIEKIMVRSPMTCEAPLGICAKCYGMDLSTGMLVEQGLAVGTIAAQSIGEPGTQLTMRTFHIGGTAARGVEQREARNHRPGSIHYINMKTVLNSQKQIISTSRNGELAVLDKHGWELERYNVPVGAIIMIEDGQAVAADTVLCSWDPHSTPVIAERGGKVRFDDLIEGETVRIEKDAAGTIRRTVMDYRGDLHPQIVIEDEAGTALFSFYLSEKANIEVEEGTIVSAGTILAKTPREVAGTQDITGGLPRVSEIFDARKPRNPAVIAQVSGRVTLQHEKKRGKRTVIITNENIRDENGEVKAHEHIIPPGRQLRVTTGDIVKAGDALVEGPLVPEDILRVSGEEAVQQYLTREVQKVYRSQNVKINDKHIEIIISQMLRKMSIDDPGDTDLLEGSQIDKFEFFAKNKEIANSLKVTNAGDTPLLVGELVPRSYFEAVNAEAVANGRQPAVGIAPKPAVGSTQLLGISKAAVQSSSFISAASFQETTKVLTEAALAGKVDYLIGLKENVILGHLIPAGTGFRAYQDAEWVKADYEDEVEDNLFDSMDADEPGEFALLKDGGLDSLFADDDAPKAEENTEE
ncbi:MAG: DNA-directed RNA polymerase subunit beta' [Thermoguttaceae bacterium]|nr:DNA-directed RNA polymerase subunit beta' [Thermoguttaceae bacterium]